MCVVVYNVVGGGGGGTWQTLAVATYAHIIAVSALAVL